MFEKELSRYWKTIIETMPDGLMVVDTEGVIVSVNSAMEQLTGYTEAELVGQPCSLLNCDVCAKERKKGVDKHCALFKKKSIRRSKCTMRKKDGSLLYAIKNASILKDGGDQIIGGVETLTDLSEIMDREKVISKLRRELDSKDSFYGIIGESSVMRRTFDLIASAAQSDAPIVIYGESGTGKELVAEAIHRLGQRRDGPFIKVNCAALNESLLESELFGHVKGAFTGAGQTRIGRFEAANRGDIFLDEIGDISASVQVKLLRVLQEKKIERVGDHRPISTDVRIISATHKELPNLVKNGQFRDDLYYRIGVIPIYLPSLRDRREDIPLLISHFINRIRLKTGKEIFGMTPDAYDLLNAYSWPGNVRELINVIEYAFVICPRGDIQPEHLPRLLTGETLRPLQQPPSDNPPNPGESVSRRQQLLDVIISCDGNKSDAARKLGISRVSLYKQLTKYNITTNKTVTPMGS